MLTPQNITYIKEQIQPYLIFNNNQQVKDFLYLMHSKAFSQRLELDDTLNKSKPLMLLLSYFASLLEANEYHMLIPQGNSGLLGIKILDNADKINNNKPLTQDDIREAVSIIILECESNKIKLQESLYILARELIHNMQSNTFNLNRGDDNTLNQNQQDNPIDSEKEAFARRFETFYIDKNNKKVNYNSYKETPQEKLERLQNMKNFKNEQCRQRAIEAHKYLSGV